MTPKSSVRLEVRELMLLWRTTSVACSQQARLSCSCGPDGERRGDGMRVLAASYAPRPRMVVSVRSTSPLLWPGSATSWATE